MVNNADHDEDSNDSYNSKPDDAR